MGKEKLSERLGRKVIHGEKVTLAQVFPAKGAVIPRHQHVSEEWGCPLEGTARVEGEGQAVVFRKDELVHVSTNLPHSVTALEDCVIVYVFSPIRQDWLDGKDDYLRQ